MTSCAPSNKMNSRTRHEFKWRSGAKQNNRNSRHECFRVGANMASGMHRDAVLRFVNSCAATTQVCRVHFKSQFQGRGERCHISSAAAFSASDSYHSVPQLSCIEPTLDSRTRIFIFKISNPLEKKCLIKCKTLEPFFIVKVISKSVLLD